MQRVRNKIIGFRKARCTYCRRYMRRGAISANFEATNVGENFIFFAAHPKCADKGEGKDQ